MKTFWSLVGFAFAGRASVIGAGQREIAATRYSKSEGTEHSRNRNISCLLPSIAARN